MPVADTRKDEIEGMFSGLVAEASRGKKLICCWPPPGHVMDENQVLDGRHAMAKRVLQAFEQATKSLPGG